MLYYKKPMFTQKEAECLVQKLVDDKLTPEAFIQQVQELFQFQKLKVQFDPSPVPFLTVSYFFN